MKWFLIPLLLIASSVSASPQSDKMDSFIKTELPHSAAPGIAYAQIEGGTITSNGLGKLTTSGEQRISRDTLFPIGSLTKSFTALGIMQLVEAGKLRLDEPFSRHLPAFANSPVKAVTLRQLLNHTSGFSTIQGNSHHGNRNVSQFQTIEYLDQLATVQPKHLPGTTWEYSNANYQILGALIERVSGQSYTDYMTAQIFKPLGMKNSAVVTGAVVTDTLAPTIANGHQPWFGGVRAIARGQSQPINAPAGGIVASAQDMGLYLAMWLNDEDDLVSAKTKALMTAPSGSASPLYGLGWFIDPAQGTVYHTGLVPGAEALISFNRDNRTGVAVMVNANGGLGFSDTWYLIGGTAALAMGDVHSDDGSRWGPRFAYLSIAILPPLFLLLCYISWKHRSVLRGKTANIFGKLSLWIPMVIMSGLSIILVGVLPRFFGGSIATLQLYQPDFAWCLILAAIFGPVWALLRLALAYSGEPAPNASQ